MSDTQTALHPSWRSRNRQCLTVRTPVDRAEDRSPLIIPRGTNAAERLGGGAPQIDGLGVEKDFGAIWADSGPRGSPAPV
jgi:hypothetical protein